MGTTPRAPLWTWAKVGLALVALDVVLFRTGLFWALVPAIRGDNPTTWGLLYEDVRHLEHDPRSPDRGYLVGSSVLFLGASEERINQALHDAAIPPRVTMLTTFGSSMTDTAVLAAQALERDPWLVLYAAASRDFGKRAPLDTPVSRVLDDSSIDVPALRPRTGEERLARWVRRWWDLYRYRTFVRSALWERGMLPLAALLRGLPAPAFSADPPEPRDESALPPEALERFHFTRITPQGYRAWLVWKASRRFEDYVAWLRASGNRGLESYAAQRMAAFGPEGNRQVPSLGWMLARIRDHGARGVVVLFPENPAFRDPAAAAYFDAELSETYARLLAGAAAAAGARFVDLRDLLPAEDFYDMVHPNLAGMRAVSARLAEIVAEEWRAR